MWFKYPLIFLAMFIVAIMQNSLLAYFNIAGYFPNLVFIFFFSLVFFENKKEYELGLFTGLVAGLFLDVMSTSYFGISVIALLAVYLLEKLSVYFLKGGQDRFSFYYFILLFFGCFLLYNILLYVLSMAFKFSINIDFSLGMIIGLLYNILFACAGFYLYRFFIFRNKDNQLKLF